MNWWEDGIVRPVEGVAKFAANPKNWEKAKSYTNAGLSLIENGGKSLAANPYIGGVANEAWNGLAHGINAITPTTQAQLKGVEKDYKNSKQINEIGKAGRDYVNKDKSGGAHDWKDQAKNQIAEIPATLAGGINIINAGKDYAIQQAGKVPVVGKGLQAGLSQVLDPFGNIVKQGKDLIDQAQGKKVKDIQSRDIGKELANNQAAVDQAKREAKNRLFLGNKSGKDKLDSISKTVVNHMTDEEIATILKSDPHGDHDYDAILKDATRRAELSGASELARAKVRSGEMTPEDAAAAIDSVIGGFEQREMAGQLLTDPTVLVDAPQLIKHAGGLANHVIGSAKGVAGDISKLGSLNKASETAEASKVLNQIPDQYKGPEVINQDVPKQQYKSPILNDQQQVNIDPLVQRQANDIINPNSSILDAKENGLSGIVDPVTGKNISEEVGSKYNEVGEMPKLAPIDPKVKEAEDQITKVIMETEGATKKEYSGLEKQIMEDPRTSRQFKEESLKLLKQTTPIYIEKPTVHKVKARIENDEIDSIKESMPGITNKEAADVALLRKEDDIRKQADTHAESIFKSMEDDALQVGDTLDRSLTSMYTPPKVKINDKGSMQFDPTATPQPVQVQFRNPLQKMFHELSLPYNKAIGEGYGMRPDEYLAKTKAFTKGFAEPLTQKIFGNTSEANVQRVKQVLGAYGSELAKKAAKLQPGEILNIDSLDASRKLDHLLMDANRAPQVQNSLLKAFTKLDEIKGPKIPREDKVANELLDHFDAITASFKKIGLPEDLARKAAPFYNKVVRDSGLAVDGMTVNLHEGRQNVGMAMRDFTDMAENNSIGLHEEFHQAFNYLGADNKNVQKVLEDSLHEGVSSKGLGQLKDLRRKLKQADPSITPPEELNELMAYFVEAKDALRYGHVKENPAIMEFAKIITKAKNGDNDAAKILDNLEGMTKAVKQYADEYEQNLVTELQNTRLPDGRDAFTAINSMDPVKDVPSFMPGKGYQKSSSLTDHAAYLQDIEQRMNRMKELLPDNQTVYRGAPNQPSTGKLRVNPGSIDQLYGPGVYTSTNPNQAIMYSGVGSLDHVDQGVARVLPGKNPDFKQYHPSLERPLFWDEGVPLDIINHMDKSKDPLVQKIIADIGGPDEVAMMDMEEFINQMQDFGLQEGADPKSREALSKAMLKLYKDAGYDGFIGPNTDDLNGLTHGQGGYEVVAFEPHNLYERTPEMRKADLAAKEKKAISVNKSTSDQELKDLTDKITNTNRDNVKRINYHINKGK